MYLLLPATFPTFPPMLLMSSFTQASGQPTDTIKPKTQCNVKHMAWTQHLSLPAFQYGKLSLLVKCHTVVVFYLAPACSICHDSASITNHQQVQ